MPMPVHGGNGADVNAQPAGQRRAYRLDAEGLALDLAGVDHIVGEGGQAGLFAQGKAGVGQPAEQQALGAADFGQRACKGSQVVTPVRPVGALPDVEGFSAVHAEIEAQMTVSGKYSPYVLRRMRGYLPQGASPCGSWSCLWSTVIGRFVEATAAVKDVLSVSWTDACPRISLWACWITGRPIRNGG